MHVLISQDPTSFCEHRWTGLFLFSLPSIIRDGLQKAYSENGALGVSEIIDLDFS